MKRNLKFFALILIIYAVLCFSLEAKSAEQILPPNISSHWGELTGTLSTAFSMRDMPEKLKVKNNESRVSSRALQVTA